jgi:hypothetical protein
MSDLTQGERNERIAGAPGPVVIGGQTYLASPPSDQDMATLHNFFRQKLKNPLAAIADDLDGLPAHLRDSAIRAAVELKAGGGVKMTEEFIGQEIQKPDGAAFFAWLLVRKNHPEIKLEVVRQGVSDEAAAVKLLGDLVQATGGLGGKASGRLA